MRILYISTSFPEPDKGATLFTDFAEALLESGHDLTVAVAEEKKKKIYTHMKLERGFDVLRIANGNLYNVSFVEKGISILKLPFLMKKGIKKYLGKKKFDLILFESQPVTIGDLIFWAKKYFNCPTYLMLKDLFPQNAIDLGLMKKNGVMHRFFKGKERKLFQSADIIGCMSKVNKQYILNHYSWIKPEKVEIFPNTKKISPVVTNRNNFIRKQYGIPENACIFLLGGNMGRPQYMELLCEVIKECQDINEIFFLFVGSGTDRYKVKETIQENEIRNAMIIDSLPRVEFDKLTQECDIGLITLDPKFTIPNLPSRILSYMENSKPVLAATDKVSDLKEMIEEAQCGEWVWSGDSTSFIEKVKSMSKSKELKKMGENGRRYIEQHFSVERSVSLLMEQLEKRGILHV